MGIVIAFIHDNLSSTKFLLTISKLEKWIAFNP